MAEYAKDAVARPREKSLAERYLEDLDRYHRDAQTMYKAAQDEARKAEATALAYLRDLVVKSAQARRSLGIKLNVMCRKHFINVAAAVELEDGDGVRQESETVRQYLEAVREEVRERCPEARH